MYDTPELVMRALWSHCRMSASKQSLKLPSQIRSQGFTLLELLVALLLLSLIFLLLTSGLQFGTRAWNVGQEEPNSTSEAVTVQQLLRRVLSEVRLFMIEATPTVRRHVYFIGNQNSVRFIAPVPEHLGVGGLYEVSIYLTDDGGSRNRLEMSWRLFRETGTSSGPQREWRQVALVDKVAQIQFAYFGHRSPRSRSVVQRLARCTIFTRSNSHARQLKRWRASLAGPHCCNQGPESERHHRPRKSRFLD
jgi:prepilin-type N-terminal cleavage/methylation domain-containing protein